MKLLLSTFVSFVLLVFCGHSAYAECAQVTEGVFRNTSVERIFEIFEGDVRDGQSISELLHNEGNGHFEHPISQVMLALRFVENDQFENAFGHLEAATYVARRHELCIRDLLDEISFIIRKRALEEGLLEGHHRQLYFSLTEGFLLPNLGLFSNQFSELTECIGAHLFFLTDQSSICT